MKTLTEKELRELDAWIAENVFGWHRQKFDNGHMRQNLLVRDGFRADKYRKHGWHDDCDLINSYPHYSTDHADSMLVLEKCAEKLLQDEPSYGDAIQIQKFHDGWHVGCALSKFVAHHCESLPIAICLLAKAIFTK